MTTLQTLEMALEALENVGITGPDDDGLVWINLPGNGTTGKAILRVGKAGLIAAQCARLFEEQRTEAVTALLQQIALEKMAENERQLGIQMQPDEPMPLTVQLKRMHQWIGYLKATSNDGQHMKIPSGLSAGTCWELALELEQFINTRPQPAAQMRMPKIGDRVICIEDESLATVESLTGGGSPDIKFDDGSHGTYLLREFAELFRYAEPQPAAWVGLTMEDKQEYEALDYGGSRLDAMDWAEKRLKEKNK